MRPCIRRVLPQRFLESVAGGIELTRLRAF